MAVLSILFISIIFTWIVAMLLVLFIYDPIKRRQFKFKLLRGRIIGNFLYKKLKLKLLIISLYRTVLGLR